MAKLCKTKDHNINYLAKIITVNNLSEVAGADRLMTTIVDYQNVIVDKTFAIGDVCVFFPLECQINPDFIKSINGFRDKTLNADDTKQGFFEANCRVRAVKLRGQKSMGFIVPISQLMAYVHVSYSVDQEFDAIDDTWFVKKYEIPRKVGQQSNKQRQGRKPKHNRLIPNQFYFLPDTANFRKNVHQISPDDIISITYKYHGTSAIFSNVLVSRKLKWYEKLLSGMGVLIPRYEYDSLYSSRRVIKNQYINPYPKHYYDTDIWGVVNEEVKDKIPKGYTVYGEIVGYIPSGRAIQPKYDYGCSQNGHKFLVYRITHVNPDGVVLELNTPQIQEFCAKYGFEFVHCFYYGKARYVNDVDNWHDSFIAALESLYTDKKCFICKNNVPEEGIVIRKEGEGFKTYKLKSFKFLEYETQQMDSGEESIEELEGAN